MPTRIVLAAMAWLAASGMIVLPLGATKKADLPSSFLSQKNLRGSMQGQSGIVLDLNGDGREDLVVGAPYAHQKNAKGALLVYFGNAGGFPEQPSALLEGEGNLGWSLATLGEMGGKRLFAAGAFNGSGDNVSLAGTVTIYQGGDQPKKLAVLEGDDALDKFGYSLASGDVNGDGIPDLIVGAPFHSPTPALYQQGAVYVYFGPGYDPASRVKIPASSALGGLGFCVATGDINNDKVDDLLIGASGKVAVYFGGASLASLPDVVFTGTDAGFGRSLAVLWDVDKDGFNDIAVGASQATIGGVTDSGRLFILKGGPTKGTFNAANQFLAKIDGEPNCGRFASAILPVADLNGDGTPDLAVSAVHADGNGFLMTGKLILLSGNALTSGASVATARAIPGDARDMHLGTFMARVAGGMKLAAGAPTENANTGTVRLFDLR